MYSYYCKNAAGETEEVLFSTNQFLINGRSPEFKTKIYVAGTLCPLHNLDGPAIVDDRTPQYYIDGNIMSKEDHAAAVRKIKNTYTYHYKTDSGLTGSADFIDIATSTNDGGRTRIVIDGQSTLLHNLNGPAVIEPDETGHYYVDGHLMSKEKFDATISNKTKINKEQSMVIQKDKFYYLAEGGFAGSIELEAGQSADFVFRDSSSDKWCIKMGDGSHAPLHNIYGPAAVMSSGAEYHYIDGQAMSKIKFDEKRIRGLSSEDKIKDFRFYYIDEDNTQKYIDGPQNISRFNEVHRAVVKVDDKEYVVSRTDGPAIIGRLTNVYYIDGKHLSKEEYEAQANVLKIKTPAITNSQICTQGAQLIRFQDTSEPIEKPIRYYYRDHQGNVSSIERNTYRWLSVCSSNSDEKNEYIVLDSGHIVMLHREDGPAIDTGDGNSQYILNGKMMDRATFDSQIKPKQQQYYYLDTDGNTKLHEATNYREVEYFDAAGLENKIGLKLWNDQMFPLHNTEGPAVIHRNGHQEYYINGKLHRLDGPAIISGTGDPEYYIEGKEYTKEKYFKKLRKMKKEAETKVEAPIDVVAPTPEPMVSVSYKDGASLKTIIFTDVKPSQHFATKDDIIHVKIDNRLFVVSSDVGPAVSYKNIPSYTNTDWYYTDGKLHCLDGPAIIQEDGVRDYWINGEHYNHLQYLAKIVEIRERVNASEDQNREVAQIIYYLWDNKVHSKTYYKDGDLPLFRMRNGAEHVVINGEMCLLHNDHGPSVYNSYRNYSAYYFKGEFCNSVDKYLAAIKKDLPAGGFTPRSEPTSLEVTSEAPTKSKAKPKLKVKKIIKDEISETPERAATLVNTPEEEVPMSWGALAGSVMAAALVSAMTNKSTVTKKAEASVEAPVSRK